MKPFEIKQIIFNSLDIESNAADVATILQKEGVDYHFSEGFEDKVYDRLFTKNIIPVRENDFMRNFSFLVNRVAISGIAAIIILLLTILLTEGGSFSINSLVGLSDVYDEGLLCLLGVI